MRFIKSFSRPSTTVVVTAALAALVAASGTAFAAKLITGSQIANSTIESRHLKNNTVTGADIAANAIDSSDIKPGSVTVNDLTKGAAVALDGKDGAQGPKGDTGAAGAAGAKGDAGAAGAKGDTGSKGDKGDDGADGVAASLGGTYSAADVVITNIGGPFLANATTAGTLTLDAGTYLINGSAFFDRLNNTLPSTPVLMLALRGPAVTGNAFGADLGTAFTGQYPSSGNLEQTASTTRIVTLAETTIVTVKVFGYNADQSATGSANYNADIQVSAVKVAPVAS